MSIKFIMTRDINGFNGFGLMPCAPDDMYQISLVQNTNYTITVPDNYQNWIAIMNYTAGADVWVAYNQTATVPLAGINQNGSELNPVARSLKAGDTLSVITGDATNPVMSILFYIINPYTN